MSTYDDPGDLEAVLCPFALQFFESFMRLTNTEIKCFEQVTTLDCGGFVFGMTVMHTCLDGISALDFLKNYSRFCRDPSTTRCFIPPVHDRTLLKVTDVSQPLFQHIELIHDKSEEVVENDILGKKQYHCPYPYLLLLCYIF